MCQKNKYLSIITNFGCHFSCPYCIVKNNHIDVPETTIESLEMLKDAVKAEGANIISVSGGGDPLFNYLEHAFYYYRLFELCHEMNIPLEMHTSYINSPFPYMRCHRVVYHCRSLRDLEKVRKYGNEIVRVVFVVTEEFTHDLIDEIEAFVRYSSSIDELSFRQMVDKDYRVTHHCEEYLKSGHKKRWWYIEQGDYNTYFVNGKIYHKFCDIGKEKE